MIIASTGTPGSGKTLDNMRTILFELKAGRRVLSNIKIKLPPKMQKYKSQLFYLEHKKITPQYLVWFAVSHHDLNKNAPELQTVVVIDECQLIFSDGHIKKQDAKAWKWFFAQHRKLRYDMVMITQCMRSGMIREIRDKVEKEVTHWKLSNYPTKSVLLGLFLLLVGLLPFDIFMSVTQWMAMKDKKNLIRRLYLYKPMYGKMYDTYQIIDMGEFERLLKMNEPPMEISPKEPSGWKVPKEFAALVELPSGLKVERGGGDTAGGGDPPRET